MTDSRLPPGQHAIAFFPRFGVPHYANGYKSVKHLVRIEPRMTFCPGFADRQTRAHPRGRVAREERGRGLPGWMYRLIYRALFPPTLWYYRRMEKK